MVGGKISTDGEPENRPRTKAWQVDCSKAIGAVTARQVIGILTSETFVRDFAAEIPVTQIDSEANQLEGHLIATR